MTHVMMKLDDVVRHKRTGRVGRVTGFAHDGTTDVWIDDTGPYPQANFDVLATKASRCECGSAEHESVPYVFSNGATTMVCPYHTMGGN